MSVEFIYLLFVNALAFILMGVDKYQAIKRSWRVPESRFFVLAFIGGAVGIYLGMHCFRHKTKHPSFFIGIPSSLIVYILVYTVIKYS